MGTISSVRSPDADICTDFTVAYFWNVALPYVGMAGLGFYNLFLAAVASRLVAFERHPDLSHHRASVLVKVRGEGGGGARSCAAEGGRWVVGGRGAR